MARDRGPVGLRRRRGLSRRRRRVKRYVQGPGRGGLRRGLQVGAAAEENQAARRASGGAAREERNGGAGGVEGRQILEEQSILEGSDHVQMYVSSVGFQARRSATGGSPPPVSGVRRSDRWTARRGAPPCDMDLAGSTAILQGVGEMEAGSEQFKEPDDEKLLRVVCRWIEICRFDGKVGRFCRGERNGSCRTECNWGA